MHFPELCKDCQNPCCTRPALTTEEYIRIFGFVGNAVLQSHEPHLIEGTGMWMFKRGGCPAKGPDGCIVPYNMRPLVCRLFPFVTAPFYTDKEDDARNELVLLVGRCPQWRRFGELYRETQEELNASEKERTE